jgi:hypothetical protein
VKKALALLVVLAVAGAYAAGYWQQRQRLSRAEAERDALRQELDQAIAVRDKAEAVNRLGRLFGQYLHLRDTVAAGNYGEAQSLSSAFFDGVRAEAERWQDGTVRPALEGILARRDRVTAALARSDPSVREPLEQIEHALRQALSYPAPALPEARPPVASASPAPAGAP